MDSTVESEVVSTYAKVSALGIDTRRTGTRDGINY
jgi:hypothetical protein